ncbi:MAG: BrnT family toxin [Pseudomonadota bacterium]
MNIEFDAAKNERIIAKHGIPLALAEFMFESVTVETIDDRREHGESRIDALGTINGRVFYRTYTCGSDRRRIISLRKANHKETDDYLEAIARPTEAAARKALAAVDGTSVDAMTDADIARQLARNPDAGPILEDVAKRIKDGRAKIVRPADVAAIRAKTKLSQARFARAVRISPHTLRNWEQGRRVPEGPARAILMAIERAPAAVLEALKA